VNNMIQITQAAFNAISTDYRGIWSGINGRPEWIGRRTLINGSMYAAGGVNRPETDGGLWLAIEGQDFEIVKEGRT